MSNLFELNKYENQVDTLITVCFILSSMSTLATAIAWIGLAACTVLLGLLVYYPFWCKRNDESLFVPWWILYLLYWCVFTYWTGHDLIATL